jgi:hypothetical protein
VGATVVVVSSTGLVGAVVGTVVVVITGSASIVVVFSMVPLVIVESTVAPGNEGRGAAPLFARLGLGTPVVVVDAGGGAPVVVVVGAGVVVVLSACLAGTESVGRVEWCGERAANTSVATTVTTTEQAILTGFDMELNRAPNSCRRAEGPRLAQPKEASRRRGRCLGGSPRGRKRLEATDSLT